MSDPSDSNQRDTPMPGCGPRLERDTRGGPDRGADGASRLARRGAPGDPGEAIRSASTQPPWTDPAERRGRGSGRYPSSVRDLPEAVIPDGAPPWMGRRASETSGFGDGSAFARPASDPVRSRNADETARRRGAGNPSVSQSTSTWPQPRPRPTTAEPSPPTEPLPAERPTMPARMAGSRRQVDGASDELSLAATGPERRSGRRRRSSRSAAGVSIIGDPASQRFLAVLFVALIALWVVSILRITSAGPVHVLRLDADGYPSLIGDRASLWRLPFVATMLGLGSVLVALVFSRHDAFSGRFLLGAALLVQGLLWVAAITLYW